VLSPRANNGQIGAVLPDGIPVASLIDVDKKMASLRLLSDPDVYRAEQKWLFGRTWNIIGHDSEIPNVGDYVMRQIAEDSVIVSRGREGEISVMLNVCLHRGMQVCRSEAGNASSFKCPYHGWVFGSDGKLLGAPFEREMYGKDLDKPNLGLRQARVGVYAGIIFANWDATAPPLDEYLGDYAWYLDTIFKRTTGGLECVGAPQRFTIQANWKTASEQFCGADGYHAATLHRSLIEANLPPGADPAMVQEISRALMFGVDIGSRLGHGLRAIARAVPLSASGEMKLGSSGDERQSALESLLELPPYGLPPELVPQLFDCLSAEQIAAVMTYPPHPGGMFPNVGFLHSNLRVHVPTGVDSFEMINWVLIEKDAPAAFKEALRKEMLLGFGTSGTVEQDDAETWPAMQRASTGFMGAQQSMRYQAFVGHNPPEGWGGEGLVYEGFSKDDCHWNWWGRYQDYMGGGPLTLDDGPAADRDVTPAVR
jgi:nitrite reductase/ring-hydroxylating ferredoxin subunit